MAETFHAVPLNTVTLSPGLFQQRFDLNRKYMVSLKSENLLQNHYLEAGLWAPFTGPEQVKDIHWGWESPTCHLRGQFLGHWLSAAARIYAATGDAELKGQADYIVAELARCQRENGGEWAASIPIKYLEWLARGKQAWVPHYVVHKTLMGLFDMALYAGNAQALEIMIAMARWFHRWTAQFSREAMDDLLDYETGGLLETWANLYGVTHDATHLDLIHRYDRPRLFERLLAGEDPLTNRHANTTIPEAHGAARAYEVTGDERWRRIVEAYWRCAVTDRGFFCTGGQTSGEIWTPPFEFATRLGDKTQEHCTVYNMIRLADYLLRWTGDATYADYIERNIYNGTLAQQNPQTGMITYFLPLRPGSTKTWGTPTHDFWCCHGSLVQNHTTHTAYIYYEHAQGLAVTQFIPSELRWQWANVPVTVKLALDRESSPIVRLAAPDGPEHRPSRWAVDLVIDCPQPVEFELKLRLPWWLSGPVAVSINGEAQPVSASPSSFVTLRRTWHQDRIRVELPKRLTTSPIPDAPHMVAFMDGPVVLAGLCEGSPTLYGDIDQPATLLTPDDEREWDYWKLGYRTHHQPVNFRLIPLYEVRDERYTVYFPVEPKQA